MNGNRLAQWQGWGIAVLRVVVGMVFLMHGTQKVFVRGFVATGAFMHSVGIPLPMLAGVFIALLELLGGIALVLGLFTRWFAAFLAVEMLVAVLAVHLRHGFFVPRGIEFPLTLMAASVALSVLGSDKVSLDALLKGGSTEQRIS